MLWGDARYQLTNIPNNITFDLILLDAFSPSKCPMLWSDEFLSHLAKKLAPKGRLITYSSAAAVRGSLKRAGLELGSIKPLDKNSSQWSVGTIAMSPSTKEKENSKEISWEALSPMELEHLLTRAAIPYRDPTGHGNTKEIIDRRQKERKYSDLEATKTWKQRWEKTLAA